MNGRNIDVAKNNEKVSDLQFKQQVITTVSAVLNLYWDLVSFYQDLKAQTGRTGHRPGTIRRQQEAGADRHARAH